MAKTKISEYDPSAGNNTDVNSVNIAEGCAPSGINNAIREVMAALKRFETGADGDSLTVGGALVVSGNTSLGNASISAADITSATISGGTITGITDITVADGGTGRSTLTANNILVGNGTSAVDFVAPGDSGNILTSNGTAWTSAAPAATASGGINAEVFTSNGTFTIPTGVTAVKVTVVGGGGGRSGTGGTSSVASGTETISTVSATGGSSGNSSSSSNNYSVTGRTAGGGR